jgi:hypothetical protein
MTTLKLNAAKAGPIIEQLKACGDGLTACGDIHAGALIHAVHSHLAHVYTTGDYLNASFTPNKLDAAGARKLAVFEAEHGYMIRKLGIDISAAAAGNKISLFDFQTKLDAAGIKGQAAITAKLDFITAGLVARE